jgi:DNA-binding LacI/PurR family transcriptional regulator
VVYEVNIDKKSNLPLYKQVYEALKEDIINETYKSGDLLPSERQLGEMFNVDRITIRKALEILVEDGMVDKIAGLGTKIKEYTLKNLREETANNIVFLLPKSRNSVDRITEPFNSTLFYSVGTECKSKGYNLQYYTVDDEDKLSELLFSSNISGVISVSKVNEKFYDEIARINLPIVLVNNSYECFPNVMVDNEKGAYDIVNYLIGLGHKRIGTVTGIKEYVTSEERLNGYKHALSDAGISWQDQMIEEGGWTFETGFAIMKKVLAAKTVLPTAIFAANDTTALGVIEALKEAGLTVPGDVSVVGFDNIDSGKYTSPHLTTVGVDIKTIGKVACQTLFNNIDSGERINLKMVIPTSLYIRDSADIPWTDSSDK